MKRYQNMAKRSAIYQQAGIPGIVYVTLGLVGEAGELANKIKKVYRDHNGVISTELKQTLQLEIGDTLWYISQLCTELGLSLDIVATANLAKLAKRKHDNTLSGDGDNR